MKYYHWTDHNGVGFRSFLDGDRIKVEILYTGVEERYVPYSSVTLIDAKAILNLAKIDPDVARLGESR